MHPQAKPVDLELQRRELDRIANSRLFARAGKLRRLVRWLGDRVIAGAIEKPSEYVVGVEALGKPHDFDPSYDVSVRQLKRRLCARLATFYSSEGRDSRLRLVCDRGFALRFEVVPASAAHFPAVVVMPIQGDELGAITGLLSHALMETGRFQVISRAAPLQAYTADFLIEGEVIRHANGVWELSVRLVEAANGHVRSGLRLDGAGEIGQAVSHEAAARLVRLLSDSTNPPDQTRS